MCIRDSPWSGRRSPRQDRGAAGVCRSLGSGGRGEEDHHAAVSYTHLRAHETVLDLVCRLLLEKKQKKQTGNGDTLAMAQLTHT